MDSKAVELIWRSEAVAIALRAADRRDQEWPLFHSENVMLAERFKAAGYSTFGISSFIYVVAHFGFAQG